MALAAQMCSALRGGPAQSAVKRWVTPQRRFIKAACSQREAQESRLLRSRPHRSMPVCTVINSRNTSLAVEMPRVGMPAGNIARCVKWLVQAYLSADVVLQTCLWPLLSGNCSTFAQDRPSSTERRRANSFVTVCRNDVLGFYSSLPQLQFN